MAILADKMTVNHQEPHTLDAFLALGTAVREGQFTVSFGNFSLTAAEIREDVSVIPSSKEGLLTSTIF